MDVGPLRAANDAARVTQNVTAITLINNRKPGVMNIGLMEYQIHNANYLSTNTNYFLQSTDSRKENVKLNLLSLYFQSPLFT